MTRRMQVPSNGRSLGEVNAENVASLLRCERGAMYIEALVMIPIFVLLWIVLIFIEHGNSIDNDVVERGRYCAWRHAADQCKGSAPAQCQVSGRQEVSFAILNGASNSSLTTLMQRTPFLVRTSEPMGIEWMYPHGGYFRADTEDDLDPPLGWSSIHVTADQTWMCQVPDSFWTYPLVYFATCAYYGLEYCPTGGGSGGGGGGGGGGGNSGGGFSDESEVDIDTPDKDSDEYKDYEREHAQGERQKDRVQRDINGLPR